eukprot:scaffold144049_cov18-Tisochrysis_lutea.AAC.2
MHLLASTTKSQAISGPDTRVTLSSSLSLGSALLFASGVVKGQLGRIVAACMTAYTRACKEDKDGCNLMRGIQAWQENTGNKNPQKRTSFAESPKRKGRVSPMRHFQEEFWNEKLIK